LKKGGGGFTAGWRGEKGRQKHAVLGKYSNGVAKAGRSDALRRVAGDQDVKPLNGGVTKKRSAGKGKGGE